MCIVCFDFVLQHVFVCSVSSQDHFSLDKVLRTRQLVFDFDGERPIPRLRDPLDLLTIPSTSCPFQGVRWPIECEVIRDKIQHIGISALHDFKNKIPLFSNK